MKKLRLFFPLALVVLLASACVNPLKKDPIADFSVSGGNCTAPCTVQFSNNSEHADEYDWSFGDGNSATISDPEHLYTEPGTYEVTLNAYNTKGADQASTTVTINGTSSSLYDKFYVTEFVATQIPVTNNGSDWDPAATVNGNEFADVYFQIVDSSGAVFVTSDTYSNLENSSLPVRMLSFGGGIFAGNLNGTYYIKFYDEDSSSGDDLMGQIAFVPNDYLPTSQSSSSSEAIISGDGFSGEIHLQWQ